MWRTIAPLCAFLVCGQLASAQRLGRPGTFAQELAAARRAGFPTTPKDLAIPSPPADRNAATYYRQLDALLTAKPFGPAEEGAEALTLFGGSTEDLSKARQALELRRDMMALIHRAAACERCIFTRDWTQWPWMDMPEYSRMRLAVRWLRMEGAVQVADGKPLEAVATVALGFRVARHDSSDPCMLGWLSAQTVDRMVIDALGSILQQPGCQTPAVAHAVRAAVDTGYTDRDLERALRCNLVTDLIDLRRMRAGPRAYAELAGENGENLSPNPGGRKWQSIVDANGAYVLWYTRVGLAALRRPWHEQKRVFDALEADMLSRGDHHDLSVLLGVISCPQFANCGGLRLLSNARADCLRVGAAVIAWKAEHGALPQRLSQALARVPDDPFDRNPLRYRREGAGFVVWSVGEDGRFDGGAPGKRLTHRQALFRFVAPSPSRP